MSITRNGAAFRTYGYDEIGNTSSITENGQVRTFTWNQDNRLTGINLPGTTADPSYAYNGAGTRVSRTLSGATQSWKRSGAGVTASVLNDGTNDYSPFSNSRANGQSTFWHSGLKNVGAQSQGASLSATKEYDAFGNSTNATGAWQTLFGYAGGLGYQETDAGLRLLGHRYYDSETGRFLTRDPIKSDRNWYVYCGNNPIDRVDANGLIGKEIETRCLKLRMFKQWEQIKSDKDLKQQVHDALNDEQKKNGGRRASDAEFQDIVDGEIELKNGSKMTVSSAQLLTPTSSADLLSPPVQPPSDDPLWDCGSLINYKIPIRQFSFAMFPLYGGWDTTDPIDWFFISILVVGSVTLATGGTGTGPAAGWAGRGMQVGRTSLAGGW